MITIQLTTAETNQVIYALKELANRRQEQAIDARSQHNAQEAHDLRHLAARIYATIEEHEH